MPTLCLADSQLTSAVVQRRCDALIKGDDLKHTPSCSQLPPLFALAAFRASCLCVWHAYALDPLFCDGFCGAAEAIADELAARGLIGSISGAADDDEYGGRTHPMMGPATAAQIVVEPESRSGSGRLELV